MKGIVFMRIQQTQSNVNFNALLRAQYSCKLKNKPSSAVVSIVQLEKKDYKIAEQFLEKVDEYSNGDAVKRDILKDTFLTLNELFQSNCQFLDKLKVLVAVHDKKPIGILIGNIPKKTLDGYVTYSSRHNSCVRETEVDWLVTWAEDAQQKIMGTGKALMSEFFTLLKRDKLNDVFVRSEIPENSYAQSFYEQFGFEPIMNKRQNLNTKTTNIPLVKDYGVSTDQIIPMLAKSKNFKDKVAQITEQMDRLEFCPQSRDVERLIEC